MAASTVSRWRPGKVPCPERHMARLEAMSRELRSEHGGDYEDATYWMIIYRFEGVKYVRRMLNYLNNRGRSDADIARYLGRSKTLVSKWHARTPPNERDLEELEHLRDETVAAEEEKKRRQRRIRKGRQD